MKIVSGGFLPIFGILTTLYALASSLWAMEREYFEKSSSIQKKIIIDNFAGQKLPSLFNPENFNQYYKLALNNDAEAQYNIGFFFENGYVVKQDYKEAREWYLKAAQKKHVQAQIRIGLLYYRGEGGQKDSDKALEYFLECQEKPEALYLIGILHLNGDGPLEGDILKPGQCALYWLLRAAEQNYSQAQNTIGFIYAGGEGGIKQDYKVAMEWYLKAAQQNNSLALKNIGDLYYRGQGVSKNLSEAWKWYSLAVKHGNTNAKLMLHLIKLDLEASSSFCIIS